MPWRRPLRLHCACGGALHGAAPYIRIRSNANETTNCSPDPYPSAAAVPVRTGPCSGAAAGISQAVPRGGGAGRRRGGPAPRHPAAVAESPDPGGDVSALRRPGRRGHYGRGDAAGGGGEHCPGGTGHHGTLCHHHRRTVDHRRLRRGPERPDWSGTEHNRGAVPAEQGSSAPAGGGRGGGGGRHCRVSAAGGGGILCRRAADGN